MTRSAQGGALRLLITVLGVGMSLYHIHIAYMGGYEPLFQRSVSFLFAVTMIFLIRRVPAEESPWGRSLAAGTVLLAVASVGWILWNYDYFIDRFPYVHPPKTLDLVFGTIAILVVLEACRRTINLALPAISVVFLLYTYFGPYFPWELAHKGAGFALIIDHQYMGTEGLWTTPMSVFSVYIFLFILFGAFLDRMGAADFYVKLAIALAGHRRGGPGKAAIAASALTGTITGSTNANVVTTGTFTIPMMKRAGFRPEFAGAVETAASTGGQIMPPVMGASAFLIAEFTGISYWEIVKVSVLPALLYFFSVYMFVHLEACKEGLKGLPREQLPPAWETFREGWYFLLPPVVIIAVMSAGRTVPFAGLVGILTVVALGAMRGLKDLIGRARREGITAWELARALLAGLRTIVDAMELGARQSLSIAAACATVGIVMGALFQTGLGVKFSGMVISLSQGSLFLGIIFVGLASFVLGMGLPTSAAYIVLSVMAVPALLQLGEGVGLTLLAAHLIVFWYSLDSCFTPPVCVPAYTAAGIANAHPSRTAWTSFKLAKGMYVLPFLFAYAPAILLNSSPLHIAETFTAAFLGFVAAAGSLQGYLYRPLVVWERVFLALTALVLFWPGTFWNAVGAGMIGWMIFLLRPRVAGQGAEVRA